MKNKIENLIKEVGINEVESILKEMKSKSKVNVKQDIKKDFIELISGCTISFVGDDIDYKKDGDFLFYYRKTNNYFNFRYKFWLDFEKKYSLNYQELKDLLVEIVEEVLNYKRVTPGIRVSSETFEWKRY